MLDRIAHISLESDFRKSRRGNKYGKYKSGLYSKATFDVNDSISFSPASKYLSRTNWLLREFQQSNEGKIIIEFNYSGFSFDVSLDLETLASINSIVYKISKNRIENPFDKHIAATFKVSIGNGSNGIPLQKELNGLEQVFSRFSSLELGNELNSYNYELIDTLLEGLYSLLQSDFQYLNNTLLQFLEKQTNKKVGSLTSRFRGSTTEITLQKIKPISLGI